MCGHVRYTEARNTCSKPFLVVSVQGVEARAFARQCQYYHLLPTTPGTCQWGMGHITVPGVYPLSTWQHRVWPDQPHLYLHKLLGMDWNLSTVKAASGFCSIVLGVDYLCGITAYNSSTHGSMNMGFVLTNNSSFNCFYDKGINMHWK